MISENHQGLLQRYQTTLLITFLTFAGLFARVIGLGEWDYYHDEVWHVYVASQHTITDVFYTNIREDGHPVLGYFLWHYLLQLWNDPWMARLPSLIAGTLCIPAGYFLGKEMFQSRNGGLFAAFFMAFSCLVIEQSDVVRGYALMLFFSVIAMWSVYRYRRTFDIRFILLYFLATSLSLLSEFAAAPVVAYTALHLAFSLLKKPSGRLPLFALWVFMHSVWAVYLLWFTLLLKTLGNVDFSQSHIFLFNHETQAMAYTMAAIVIYFLEYANLAGFFWFIGGSLQSEILVVITLLAFLVIILVGVVAMYRQKLWEPLVFILIMITVTIGFYWLNMVPLSMPRRNMAVVLIFMILSYYGIRHCAIALAGHRYVTAPQVIWICSASILVGYFFQGDSWRNLRLTEFQQTRAQAEQALHTIKSDVADNDLVISDLYSMYHLWVRDGKPAFHYLTNNVIFVPDYKPRLAISPTDLRVKAFALDPYEIQLMLREMDRLGKLRDVKNIWIFGLQHTNVKTIVIDPTYRSYLKMFIPDPIEPIYADDLNALIDEQEVFAGKLYKRASFKDIGFATPCDSSIKQRTGLPYSCIVNTAIFKLPIKMIYEEIINAPDYRDVEAFFEKVQHDRHSR